MGLFSNGLKGNIIAGLAIGVGTAVLAPIIVPVLASVAKPLTKAAIKGGITLYEKNREKLAEMNYPAAELRGIGGTRQRDYAPSPCPLPPGARE